MNSNYTQVNIEQLRTLITSMSRAQGSCSNALNNFTNVMDGSVFAEPSFLLYQPWEHVMLTILKEKGEKNCDLGRIERKGK